MAGEIQLNSTNFASESSGTITINNATVGSAVAMSANQACVKTAINASGSAPIYACRAWINFDGTSASIGTGRANGNVSGVTDHDPGDYTITFTTAMPDANYAIAGLCANTSSGKAVITQLQSQVAGSFRISTAAGLGGSGLGDSSTIVINVIR